jgi:hypothetical protein
VGGEAPRSRVSPRVIFSTSAVLHTYGYVKGDMRDKTKLCWQECFTHTHTAFSDHYFIVLSKFSGHIVSTFKGANA